MKLIQGWAFAVFLAKLGVGDNVRLSARSGGFGNTLSSHIWLSNLISSFIVLYSLEKLTLFGTADANMSIVFKSDIWLAVKIGFASILFISLTHDIYK